MRLQKYFLILCTSLCTSASIVLLDRPSAAFNITPGQPGATSGYYRQASSSIRQGKDILTEIDRELWFEPLKRGGTPMFNFGLARWAFLKSDAGPFNWSFQPATRNLRGNFEVVTYQACSPRDQCGGASTQVPAISEVVGALFHLKYNPAESDPQPGQGKLHWIQVVRANYEWTWIIPKVDNYGRPSNPFYDMGDYLAGEDFFIDRPYTGQVYRNNFFDARLYLVEEITPPGSQRRTIKVHNGIRWGWTSEVRKPFEDQKPPAPPSRGPSLGQSECPEPPYSQPIEGGCSLGYFGFYGAPSALVSSSFRTFSEPSEPFSSTDELQSPADEPINAAATPEPASILGTIVAAGSWAGLSWKKRKPV